jgi:hypothetical protein
MFFSNLRMKAFKPSKPDVAISKSFCVVELFEPVRDRERDRDRDRDINIRMYFMSWPVSGHKTSVDSRVRPYEACQGTIQDLSVPKGFKMRQYVRSSQQFLKNL